MNLFDKKIIGRKVECVIEKDGKQLTVPVRWHRAFVGEVINTKIMVMKDKGKKLRSNYYVSEKLIGWTILQVGV